MLHPHNISCLTASSLTLITFSSSFSCPLSPIHSFIHSFTHNHFLSLSVHASVSFIRRSHRLFLPLVLLIKLTQQTLSLIHLARCLPANLPNFLLISLRNHRYFFLPPPRPPYRPPPIFSSLFTSLLHHSLHTTPHVFIFSGIVSFLPLQPPLSSHIILTQRPLSLFLFTAILQHSSHTTHTFIFSLATPCTQVLSLLSRLSS